ncbi:protein C3orf33 [Anticarsia gemmatalis]|uniref:protein C3orf33 n=1 Tax=Anticarsia gemmatalis TaxID=129554 RepID=UPI003F762918
MALKEEGGFFYNVQNLLQQDYRGVNIAVYALATAGLAVSIHKIRPVSKFSKASKVPDHFIKQHEPLRGTYAGVQHSPVRVLVNHKAPIHLPLWHTSKPPLSVKLWGVDIVSGNAVNWLECVARGHQVTLKPIGRDKEDLVSAVSLHLPQSKAKSVETLDIGQKLIELGFAKASVPKDIKKNTIESQLAPALLSAEAHAKNYRNGIWSDSLPPLPLYVVYWRKGSQWTADITVLTLKTLVHLLILASKGALIGVKNLALWPFRASRKQVQAT